VDRIFENNGLAVARIVPPTEDQRAHGGIWPAYADTMVGMLRLDNLQTCVESVLQDNVAGDFIETGVWRGGSCILMRGILAAFEVTDRKVFVADSFQGLPEPDPAYPVDAGTFWHLNPYLAVSRAQVEQNFRRYNLLDDQVVFLEGWFHETLPTAPIERLAILRLDGDMYGSTIVTLDNLYPKLSSGGFCIIDDYNVPGAREATTHYRQQHGINDPIIPIDRASAYWRKS